MTPERIKELRDALAETRTHFAFIFGTELGECLDEIERLQKIVAAALVVSEKAYEHYGYHDNGHLSLNDLRKALVIGKYLTS